MDIELHVERVREAVRSDHHLALQFSNPQYVATNTYGSADSTSGLTIRR